jgi:hypothetical protein
MPYRKGVLLWFEINDLDPALTCAQESRAEIIMPLAEVAYHSVRHHQPLLSAVKGETASRQ